MNKNDIESFPPLTCNQDKVMSVAAIFEEEFSVDWLEELTGLKATLILTAVEKGSRRRYTPEERSRRLPLCRQRAADRRRLPACPGTSTSRYCRIMASILIRELADDDAKALKVATYLRSVSNDAEGCRWLVRAGKIYAGSSTEMAIDCFRKGH